MKAVCFHIKGKMAHFRRYYSNSSSLSYTIPPRTTIIGMIAGLLGYPRDSYYDEFSISNCDVAVSSQKPLKKLIQKMNILMIKGNNDLNGSKENHTQCATEFVIPQNIIEDELDYKVWFCHKNDKINQSLEKLLDSRNNWFGTKGVSIALGSAQNLGWIEYEGSFEFLNEVNEGFVRISSCVPVQKIIEIETSVNEGSFILKEELPLEFDGDRVLSVKNNFVLDKKGKPLNIKVKDYVKLENGENILWMR